MYCTPLSTVRNKAKQKVYVDTTKPASKCKWKPLPHYSPMKTNMECKLAVLRSRRNGILGEGDGMDCLGGGDG